MFDFRLKVFHAVAKRLSFTKAAADLFITQPAVTKHIKELEQYYKVQLFERKGNQIKLTREGKLMLQYSEQLFTVYRNMEFDLSSFSNSHKGLLQIGASSTISQYIIPATLSEFHKKYQDVVIKLMNGNTEQIETALVNNDIDLGIIEGTSKNKGIKYSRFIKDEILLVSRANHPLAKKPNITIDELRKLPLLIREPGSGTLGVIAQALKPFDLSFSELNVEMDLGSTEAIKTYLRNSQAVAFLSIHAIATELQNDILRVIDVDGLQIDRYFYFIERQGSSEHLSKLFLQFVRHYNFK